MTSRDPILQQLIDRHRLRGLAAPLGITRSAVQKWRRVPPQHVPALAVHLGLRRHDLRPDLWGPGRQRRSSDLVGDEDDTGETMEAAA
jgi:DNA-binding transcriptional regulator YdaS (Cro superfamily)